MIEETDLPPGWEWATFPEVAEINPRTGFEAVEDEQVVSFVPMAAVSEEIGKIDLSSDRFFLDVKKGYTRFVENDVIFAKITPCMENGKIAIARGLTNGLACGSTEFHVVRPAVGIAPDYLRYFLVQRSFRQDAERQMQGAVGQKRVSASYLQSSGLPIAPAAEQWRIVEKIDELFSLIEAGEQALARARKLLERYRQSVLNAAVTGELTKEWRERHKGEIESGEDLLKRILKARREAWEKAELAKMHARGKPPTNDRWKQKYKSPQSPDTSNLPEVPKGWVWASLDQITSGRPRSMQSGPFGSNLKHSEFQPHGHLVLGIDNVGYGNFSSGSQNRISEQKFRQLQKYQVRPGDLLITVMASLGRSCVVPYDIEPAIVTKHIYRITLDQDLILPDFVNIVLQGSAIFRKKMLKDARGQTRPGLNSEILKPLPIPLPTFAEQIMISELLQAASSEWAAFKSDLAASKKLATALRQSILLAAFSGKLVPQDPTDEPASVLLAHIRAKRASISSQTISVPKRKRIQRRARPSIEGAAVNGKLAISGE